MADTFCVQKFIEQQNLIEQFLGSRTHGNLGQAAPTGRRLLEGLQALRERQGPRARREVVRFRALREVEGLRALREVDVQGQGLVVCYLQLKSNLSV